MSEIIPFRRKTAKEKARGKTLCRSGFHKWVAAKERPFDVKQGKLLTLFRCSRCGATKTEKT
ncbi:MAG TPA: hypothetical protein ENJ01_07910 [Gammaproteobacteria bacterium]|nr:hypothetical protein [Gammaproteobacteria bacterium]